jgi:Na+-driven multidrug efflux pump
MAFVTFFLMSFAEPIVHIFTQDEAVAMHGISALRIIASGYIFYGIAMVMTQALNGAGDTKTPTWINFFCCWIFQTPFAYFLAKETGLGAKGVIIAIPAAQAILAAVAWYFFKIGKWKKVKV